MAIEKGIDHLCWIAGFVSALGVLAIALMLSYEVIMRYVFRSPTIWTFSFSIYTSTGIGLLGSAWALRTDAHVKVDLVVRWMSEKMRRVMEIIGCICGLVFSTVLAWKGWEMVMLSYTIGRVSSDTLNTPIFIPQLAVPLGAALLCLQLIRLISVNLSWLAGDRGSEEHRAWEYLELGATNGD